MCMLPKRRFGKDEQAIKCEFSKNFTPPKRRFWKAEPTFQNSFPGKHFSGA
jgi:hypothetical protein